MPLLEKPEEKVLTEEQRIDEALDKSRQKAEIILAMKAKQCAFPDFKNDNLRLYENGNLKVSDTKSLVTLDADGFPESDKLELNGAELSISPHMRTSKLGNMHQFASHSLGKNLYQDLTGCDDGYFYEDGTSDVKKTAALDFEGSVFKTARGQALKELIQALMHKKPEERPSVEKALQRFKEIGDPPRRDTGIVLDYAKACKQFNAEMETLRKEPADEAMDTWMAHINAMMEKEKTPAEMEAMQTYLERISGQLDLVAILGLTERDALFCEEIKEECGALMASMPAREDTANNSMMNHFLIKQQHVMDSAEATPQEMNQARIALSLAAKCPDNLDEIQDKLKQDKLKTSMPAQMARALRIKRALKQFEKERFLHDRISLNTQSFLIGSSYERLEKEYNNLQGLGNLKSPVFLLAEEELKLWDDTSKMIHDKFLEEAGALETKYVKNQDEYLGLTSRWHTLKAGVGNLLERMRMPKYKEGLVRADQRLIAQHKNEIITPLTTAIAQVKSTFYDREKAPLAPVITPNNSDAAIEPLQGKAPKVKVELNEQEQKESLTKEAYQKLKPEDKDLLDEYAPEEDSSFKLK